MSVTRAGSQFIIPRRPFDCGYWSDAPGRQKGYRLIDLEEWTEAEVLAGSLRGAIVRLPDSPHLSATRTPVVDKTTASLLDASSAVEDDFATLVDDWERETVLESLPSKMAMHRAYQRIIGLGPPAVPLILRRLAETPNYWFWALTSITGQDPAERETTLDGATARWLEWGREHDLIA